MNDLFSHVKRFVAEEEGAIAIEYALLAALIGVALIAAVVVLRKEICSVFNTIGAALKSPSSAPATTACTT